jgi:muramidase (phage lysozyme)
MAKPELSEQTKGTTSSLLSRGVEKTRSLVSKLFGGDSSMTDLSDSSNPEILGTIYKMMVKSEVAKKLEIQEKQNYFKEEQKEKDNRNQEIIQALTGKKTKGSKPGQKTPAQQAPAQAKPGGTPAKPGGTGGTPAKPGGTGGTPAKPPGGTPAKPPGGTPAKPPGGTPAKPPGGTPAKPPAKPPAGTPAKPPAPPAPKPPAPPAPPAVPGAPVIPPVAPGAGSAAATAAKVAVGAALVTAGNAALASSRSTAERIALFESKSSAGKSFDGNEYNAYNRGTINNKMIPANEPINFSKWTISDYLNHAAKTKQFPEGNPNLKPGGPTTVFTIGRYQIIPPTMLELVKKLKIDPKTTYLTPETQDYLFSEGIIKRKRKLVDDYLHGRNNVTRDAAILELAKEFSSIGVPYDIKQGSIGKKLPKTNLKRGESLYSGIGGNKAHNSPEEIGKALDIDRERNLKSGSNTPQGIPSGNNSGQTIDSGSKLSADAKKALNAQQQKNTANNIAIDNSSDTTKKNVKKEDDTNAMIRAQRAK